VPQSQCKHSDPLEVTLCGGGEVPEVVCVGQQLCLRAEGGDPFGESYWTVLEFAHVVGSATGSTVTIQIDAPGPIIVGVHQGQHHGAAEFNAVVCVDLDIDGDNNNGTNPPDRSEAEENLENVVGNTGFKFIAVNRDNDDDALVHFFPDVIHERIDDFGDGFDFDGTPGGQGLGLTVFADDNANPQENDFIPLVLELKEPIDLNVAKVTMSYSSSWDSPPAATPRRRRRRRIVGF
jgi:hypothetical protein